MKRSTAACSGSPSSRLWPSVGRGRRGRRRPQRSDAGPPTFAVAGGRLRVEVCADDIVRVAFAKDDAFFARPSLMAAPKRCTAPAWKLTKTDKTATIATAKLRVDVDLDDRGGVVSRRRGPADPRRARRADGR